MTAWTGKNAKERVIEVTRLMGETLSISMSVQSMDAQVLKTIERGNIKIDHYRAISDELSKQGRPQHTEVIMPLPGETFESHIRGLNELLDLKVSRVFSHTLQMLHGTPYKDDESYVRRYGYQTKWRLVPLDFSDIEGERIFDTEEVAVATTAFGFAEYIEARKYLFIIDICFNSGLFDPLRKYLRSLGIKISDWIARVYRDASGAEEPALQVYEAFAKETQSELWDTEKSLVKYYSLPENYRRLVDGEIGGNVLFKHRVWMLSKAAPEWTRFVFRMTRSLLREHFGAAREEALAAELGDLERYVSLTMSDSFSPETVSQSCHAMFDYDILAWLSGAGPTLLAGHLQVQPMALVFSYSDRNLGVALDGFKRYGTDLSGLVKLVQRSYFTFTRSAAYAQGTAGGGARSGDKNHTNRIAPALGPGYSAM